MSDHQNKRRREQRPPAHVAQTDDERTLLQRFRAFKADPEATDFRVYKSTNGALRWKAESGGLLSE